jgi:hypothetical protein
MNYGEIEEVLKEHGQNSMIEQLREAIGREAVDLMAGFDKLTEETAIAQARDFYATDISRWLEEGGMLDAKALLEHRSRYSQSWAFAAIIESLQQKEIEEIAIPEVDPDTLTRICIANAELGSLVADLIGRIHAPVESDHPHPSYNIFRDLAKVLDHAKAPDKATSGRYLSCVERLEALLEQMEDGQMVSNQPTAWADPGALMMKALENICWLVANIHQAHHKSGGEWRTCSEGTCNSVAHILAQSGHDKNLQPIPVLL